MNILWLCNVKLPQISKALKESDSQYGGWLTDMANRVMADKNKRLITLYPGTSIIDGKIENLSYYSFLEKNCAARFSEIISKEKSEIVHIWGTEFRHSSIMVDACEQAGIIDRVVISIQGLVSIYYKHYCLGLPERVISHKTFYELVKGKNIRQASLDFKMRGINEIHAIEKVRHIIGRTDFDKACTTQINGSAEYHFCNETLRKEFYGKKWALGNIKKHSIFVSQSNYPVKGFHFLLEAMPLILKQFPDAHIYTTGAGLPNSTIHDRLRMTSYGNYLLGLIKKNYLEKHITFLGNLNAEQMCEQYLSANVFVSPSTIENSSNSIGEAMLVGCPVVSSAVGGVNNMLVHDSEGYVYQVDAPYMLAYYIMKIFDSDETALRFSEKARVHASITHNSDNNYNTLINIYSLIRRKC